MWFQVLCGGCVCNGQVWHCEILTMFCHMLICTSWDGYLSFMTWRMQCMSLHHDRSITCPLEGTGASILKVVKREGPHRQYCIHSMELQKITITICSLLEATFKIGVSFNYTLSTRISLTHSIQVWLYFTMHLHPFKQVDNVYCTHDFTWSS